MTEVLYKKLMCVDRKANCNKFYEMRQLDANEFEVIYGREGGHKTRRVYPMSKWNSVYRDKTRPTKKPEPYRDITDYCTEEVVTDAGAQTRVSSISDTAVASLLSRLQAFARGSIAKNYRVASTSVTQLQVDEAQSILDAAADIVAVAVRNNDTSQIDTINDLLIDLYHIIPRRMGQVRDYMVDQLSSAPSIIGSEQDTLDVMSQQVSVHERTDESSTDSDILDVMGISIAQATSGEISQVQSRAGDDARKIVRVYRVENEITRKRFNEHFNRVDDARKEKRLFWHGTRNENVLSIMQKGLLIRPSGVVTTGSMFGDGIYFAPKFQKSYGYTSARGSYYGGGSSDEAYMGMFWVHLGKILKIDRHSSDCYSLNARDLARRGYDSVHGARGYSLYNDEFIVYKPDQCTIAFLVQIR